MIPPINITVGLNTESLLMLSNVAVAIEKLTAAFTAFTQHASTTTAFAPAPVNAPAQRPVAFVRSTPWSEERREVLRRLYPTMPAEPGWKEKIRGALEMLPGGPLPSNDAIMAYAAGILRLKRPCAPPKQTPLETATTTAPAPRSAPDAVVANLVQVARWAAERGIQVRNRDDIPAANAKRVQLGLPPFSVPEVR